MGFNENKSEQIMNELATSLIDFKKTKVVTKNARKTFEKKYETLEKNMSKESQRSPTKLSRKNVKEANKIIDQASKIKKAIDSVEKMHGPLVQKFAAWKATKAATSYLEEAYEKANVKTQPKIQGLAGFQGKATKNYFTDDVTLSSISKFKGTAKKNYSIDDVTSISKS